MTRAERGRLHTTSSVRGKLPRGPGLRAHRVLASQTLAGRGSMVRQLQPRVHYESDAGIVQELTGKARAAGTSHKW